MAGPSLAFDRISANNFPAISLENSDRYLLLRSSVFAVNAGYPGMWRA